MTKTLDPNSRGYTNALLEDINDKFEAVLEVTKPIPEMQKTLKAHTFAFDKIQTTLDVHTSILKEHAATLKEHTNILTGHTATLKEHTTILTGHTATLKEHTTILTGHTSAITGITTTLDATFEEVGLLRLDVEEIKRSLQDINRRLDVLEAAMKLLDRHSPDIADLKKRVKSLERAIAV